MTFSQSDGVHPQNREEFWERVFRATYEAMDDRRRRLRSGRRTTYGTIALFSVGLPLLLMTSTNGMPVWAAIAIGALTGVVGAVGVRMGFGRKSTLQPNELISMSLEFLRREPEDASYDEASERVLDELSAALSGGGIERFRRALGVLGAPSSSLRLLDHRIKRWRQEERLPEASPTSLLHPGSGVREDNDSDRG